MSQKVLIVEDEKSIVDILCFNLQKEGYETLEAYDGLTGLRLALAENPDIILLDWMLPGLDGLGVCQGIRDAGSTVPVLMITAKEEEKDKILGLESGADDYITKPFSIRELLARIKANIRRVNFATKASSETHEPSESQENLLKLGRFLLNYDKASIYKDGEELELTQREFELMKHLMSHVDKVFSRNELMEMVWNYEGFVGDLRGVDVTVRRLREKIEDTPAEPKFILTKRGLGYYFSVE